MISHLSRKVDENSFVVIFSALLVGVVHSVQLCILFLGSFLPCFVFILITKNNHTKYVLDWLLETAAYHKLKRLLKIKQIYKSMANRINWNCLK